MIFEVTPTACQILQPYAELDDPAFYVNPQKAINKLKAKYGEKVPLIYDLTVSPPVIRSVK